MAKPQLGLLTPSPVLFPWLVTNGGSLCTTWPHCCPLAGPGHQRHKVAILGPLGNEQDRLARLVFPDLPLTLANAQFYQALQHLFFPALGSPNFFSFSWCALPWGYHSSKSFQFFRSRPEHACSGALPGWQPVLGVSPGPEFSRWCCPDNTTPWASSKVRFAFCSDLQVYVKL